jgi:3-oxoacyl-[acyl-carrier protein] reductase
MNDGLILITGASGGVGANVTEVLLQSGWRNIACQYRTHRDEIAAILTRHSLNPAERLLQADLTQESDLAALHQTIGDRFGPVYGLVNLVGGSSNRMSWKMSRDEFQQILDLNLTTTFLTCREFIPEMRDQGRGRIVNISSVVAHTGVAGASHYCAAKAAIVGFSKSLALELAPKNIAVAVIALGYFNYGLLHTIPAGQREQIRQRIPTQEFGQAEHIAGLLSYLLSEAGAYAGGQVYHLNGGLYS